MGEGKSSFFTTLPGIFGSLATLVAALTAAYLALNGPREQPAVEAERVTAPSPGPAAAQPASVASQGPFSVAAVIDDPDGYVNVRANGSTQARIVAVVRLNEQIRTHPQSGAWWLVRTRDGTQGYVHASRIRMIEG